jgi:hypothetical protein
MQTPEQIRAANEAETLEQAAAILLRRYGLLTAGDLIGGLRNRAEAIRGEAK